MTRDETKQAADNVVDFISDQFYHGRFVTDTQLAALKVARAYLAQCEREEPALEALKNCVQWMIEHGCSHEYAVLIDAKAAIKAIEEGK